MAQLVFLREGSGPERIASHRDLPIQAVLTGLGARSARYAGTEVPTLPTDRQDLTGLRDPAYVVVRVSAKELGNPFGKVGCYFLQGVSPAEASDWKLAQ
jgi:hypothetical protein